NVKRKLSLRVLSSIRSFEVSIRDRLKSTLQECNAAMWLFGLLALVRTILPSLGNLRKGGINTSVWLLKSILIVDVLELDKANEFSVGRQLRVGRKYTYSDLDELIVSHIKSMARKVDEMTTHEKFQRGSRADTGIRSFFVRGIN